MRRVDLDRKRSRPRLLWAVYLFILMCTCSKLFKTWLSVDLQLLNEFQLFIKVTSAAAKKSKWPLVCAHLFPSLVFCFSFAVSFILSFQQSPVSLQRRWTLTSQFFLLKAQFNTRSHLKPTGCCWFSIFRLKKNERQVNSGSLLAGLTDPRVLHRSEAPAVAPHAIFRALGPAGGIAVLGPEGGRCWNARGAAVTPGALLPAACSVPRGHWGSKSPFY